ncbi:MAG: hypothetical protein OEO23_03130 [Gemmatimonadota bacterium]|nr:hypothetical protein [Gemmatimonadota bacterium]
MRQVALLFSLLIVVVPAQASAQLSQEELESRVVAAQEDGAPIEALAQGAAAARLLGQHELASQLRQNARQALSGAENGLVTETIMQAMASGQGANGMLRAFRQAREHANMPPQQIAAFVNNFPTLLIGGEFDDLILRMREGHPNPLFDCACLAPKAWVHRVAGRTEESTQLWAELAEARDRNPVPDNPQAQGQYARDLARAGRTAEAREVLARAMAMEVSEGQRPGVQRRWAQALAELGDVEGAVAQLEPLLESSTLVTVNSLSTRYTWEPIRDDPAFQAMLARHR